MTKEREVLVEGILQAQKTIQQELQATATSAWIDLDLTIGQIKALMMLETSGLLTVGQAAAELGIGKPGASILLDRLVQAGLVDRKEDSIDRRRAIVQLTLEGEDLLTRLRQGKRERMQDSLRLLSDEDLESLSKGLRALSAVFSASRVVGIHDSRMGGIEGG